MRKDDLVYVGHMLEFARDVGGFLAGRSRADFDSDRLLRLAVAHLIQNIGEAANLVSPTFQKAHAHVPWRMIVGMRNRIVHGYIEVEDATVWETAVNDLPQLIKLIEPLVPSA